MTEKNGDKESKPLIYVDQAKISDLRGNMQSDFRTKKAKPQDSAEPELQEEAEHKEEKIEQVKREFGVYDAMMEIEKEITGLRKITEEYVPEQTPVEKMEYPEQIEQEIEKPVKRKRKKVEKKESSRDIISRLSNHQGFPKPLCEAVINGETLRFHVLGMRGESVKIKRGNHIRFVGLQDIIDAKIIEESK
ncbi:spore coat CotO family protein [Peribacillus frigoritolerans]|uniref:spore coat CotO family protein n=1 Tax=Peribacillus frigoritolerans TaxID=450367 RepID=UPI002079423B|nr:spore coat CotO family protein [Peribacillus frigoritolerans]USK76187.1 spore coat CotO family protein [Peribacillus frigoritolerans]